MRSRSTTCVIEQARLQNQEYDNAWKEYYMDEQIQFEEMLTQAKIQALQSNMQLETAQNAYTASALNRGAVGRRAGVRGANAAILAAMLYYAERGRQLALAQDNMDTRMSRQARRANLRKQMSFNAIGPRPERTPVGSSAIHGKHGSWTQFSWSILWSPQ